MKRILLILLVLWAGGTILIGNISNPDLTNKIGNTNMALGVSGTPLQYTAPGVSGIPAQQSGGTPIQPGGTANTGGVPVGTTISVPGRAPAPQNTQLQPNSVAPAGPTAADIAAQQAAAAAAAQQAKINSVIDAGRNSALAGGDAGAAGAASQYTAQGEGLYNTTQAGQNTIDEARKSIGLNQINGIKDLMNTIKQGLQGTGVQLGNSNALDSSAAGAAARAYGNYGNVQENKINNSAADANQGQDVNQTNLNLARDTGMETLRAFRDSSIKTIQDSAVQALSSLANTVAFLGGDAAKIDVNGIKAQILQNAQNQLGSVDQHISNMIGGVHAASSDETARNAYSASNAGATPSGPNLPFQLDSSALTGSPAQPGADGSMIPLALKSKALA